jgi:transcriptional regulator with XRE-family HTH domain
MLELHLDTPDHGRMSKKTARLIGELKKWSVERGIRQKDLAKILGVSPQLITEWFALRRSPTGEKVIEIQELLKTRK